MPHRVLPDFDTYADAIKDARVRITLRRRDLSNWALGDMSLGRFHLQWGTAGGSLVCEGEVHAGGHVLFVPLNHTAVHVINGQRLDGRSLMVAAPAAEFCIAADGWSDWFSLYIPNTSESDEEAAGDSTVWPGCRVTQVNHRQLNRIRRLVREITASGGSDTSCEEPKLRCAEQVLGELADCVIGKTSRAPASDRGRPPVNRRELLHLVEELVADPVTPARVRTLAQSAGVSERTLRRAFQDLFGTTPARYARLRRLHTAREALLAADPLECTVTAILANCGVLEFGRFAGTYRTLFGELPSQTLRRSGRMSAVPLRGV